MEMNRWARAVLVSGFAAYFAGGFIAGMVWCEGCGGDILGRLMMGTVMCAFSVLVGGFPLLNFAYDTRGNCWPYIIGCWLLFLIAFSVLSRLADATAADSRLRRGDRREK